MFTNSAFVALLLCSSIKAVELHKRIDGPPRVVAFPIQRKSNPLNPITRDSQRLKRDSTVQVSLTNEESLYVAQVKIGTPSQTMSVDIDTGSSDLWVNTAKSDLCTSSGNTCSEDGTFDANSSSTYVYVNSDFQISYADGSGASGDYVTDTVNLGGSSLKSVQFGIGYKSTIEQGILGVGYESNEASTADGVTYKNVPAAMVSQGLIQSSAYSLWLNDLDSSTGSILFGGVDTAKFEPPLKSLPIQSGTSTVSEFLITLTGIALGTTKIDTGDALAVLLDSGTSLTYLPNALTRSIYDVVGAEYDSSQGAAYADCSLATNASVGTLNFTFSDDPTVSVSMAELLIPVTDSAGDPLTFQDGATACLFGIAPSGDSSAVLGDTFLRSAYVVYDLSKNEIGIAQTKFNVSDSNVVEIASASSSGGDPIPSATAVTTIVSATAGLNGGGSDATLSLAPSGIVATSTSAGGAAMAKATGQSIGVMAAAAVGAGVMFAAM